MALHAGLRMTRQRRGLWRDPVYAAQELQAFLDGREASAHGAMSHHREEAAGREAASSEASREAGREGDQGAASGKGDRGATEQGPREQGMGAEASGVGVDATEPGSWRGEADIAVWATRGHLPTQKELRDAGRGDLLYAYRLHGTQLLASLLNRSVNAGAAMDQAAAESVGQGEAIVTGGATTSSRNHDDNPDAARCPPASSLAQRLPLDASRTELEFMPRRRGRPRKRNAICVTSAIAEVPAILTDPG